MASSAVTFIETLPPRRQKPSAVITTFAFASFRRVAIAGAPKPEKIGR